jgi:D-glycero-alpha-D-manno-heptose-7-phosphate kinase
MIITQTPLRISFAGGGTHFRKFYLGNGGGVLSSAIDKYIHIIIKERFDELIVLNYSSREIINSVDKIKHQLIRESMKKTGVEKGVEITTLADIPTEGSGLGSSSTVTVGLLHALYTYKGELVTADRLARNACEIEIDILGNPIGIQDQYIAAYGGLRAFTFQRDGCVEVKSLNLKPWAHSKLSSHLLLFYLNQDRNAASILVEQKANITRKVDVLCRMRDHAKYLKENLTGDNLDLVGEIMHKGWLKKKTLASKISNKKIDRLYQMALDAGALGGKVTGAGGGGFMLFYVPIEKQANVRKKLGHLRELPFTLEKYGSKVIFSQHQTRFK